MALQMKVVTINFDPETGGLRQETATVPFNARVRQAQVALVGFEAKFTKSDREFHQLHVDLDVQSVSGSVVIIGADFGLRDKSGVFDDEYKGFVQGLVIAETD